jgi:hypothetical protein
MEESQTGSEIWKVSDGSEFSSEEARSRVKAVF